MDLDVPETALALVARLKGEKAGASERGVRVVAFGPHVAVDDLHAAKAAGADAVMARGAFAGRMPEILKRLEGEEQVQDDLHE